VRREAICDVRREAISDVRREATGDVERSATTHHPPSSASRNATDTTCFTTGHVRILFGTSSSEPNR